MTTKRTVGVEVGGDREVGGGGEGVGQNLKKGVRQYRGEGSSKNRGSQSK